MNILKLFGNIGSPNQLKETLFSKLPPEQREMIKGMMASGKDPRETLMESAKSGKINLQKLNQARGTLNATKTFRVYCVSGKSSPLTLTIVNEGVALEVTSVTVNVTKIV